MVDQLFSDKRYRELEVLGEGGMGRVLLCEDKILTRKVALKVLLNRADQDLEQRFQKEAQSTAQLNHPNIIKVLDFGRLEDDSLYLSMELLDGIGLDQYIEENAPLEIEEALEIIDQVCLGLYHAHNHSVLHRDIKPSNIMLTEGQNGARVVKLVDFGIARFRKQGEQKLTKTGVIIGSPLYLSPGTVTAEEADVRSEVYSLGCTIFEMLTGSTPFQGSSPMDTMLMHMNDEPPKLAERAGFEFPEELETIVAKCLAKERAGRFQTVEELRLALNGFVEKRQEEQSQDKDEQVIEDEEQQSGPTIVGWTSGVVLIVLLLVSITAWFFFRSSTREATVVRKKGPANLDRIMYDGKFPIIKEVSEGCYKANPDVQDQIIEEMYRLPKRGHQSIRKIFFKNSILEGDGLRYLPSKIRTVEFQRTQNLRNDRLKELLNLPHLAKVSFVDCKLITATGISDLSKSSSLKSLTFIPASKIVSDEEYHELARMQNLDELEITDQAISVEKLKIIKSLPLTKFVFNDCGGITADLIRELGRFKSINSISAKENSRFDMQALKQLASLNLDHLGVSQRVTSGELDLIVGIRTKEILFSESNSRDLLDSYKKRKPGVKARIEEKVIDEPVDIIPRIE